MKIILISSLYGVSGGGAGIIVESLAHGLVNSGHKVSIITLGNLNQIKVDERTGIKFYIFRSSNLYSLEEKDLHPTWQKFIWQIIDIYNPLFEKQLCDIYLFEKPDVIHIHKMRGLSGAVWSASTRYAKGRVVQTCHDYESMSPDGLMRGFIGKMALERKWPVRGYQTLRAWLSRDVSILTAPSLFALRRIVASGLFASAQIRVVPNTHGWNNEELKFIQKNTENFSENCVFKFLFLGRLEPEKGILELCEAFSHAIISHPSMELNIGGWGTLDNTLRSIYGKEPGFKFLGTIDGKAKETALHNANVVVVPSLVDEVFGLVTVEAFAFGKPVIASSVGGLPELVSHGENGWLFEAGDVQALAEQLIAVAEADPSILNSMSVNCKESSYDYSLGNFIIDYTAIYNLLMA